MAARSHAPCRKALHLVMQCLVCTMNLNYIELEPGDHVERGEDWKWGGQAGPLSTRAQGEVVSKLDDDKWIKVRWKNGTVNSYRYGADGKHDVIYSPQIGDIVCRGPHWKWGEQDGHAEGKVVSPLDPDFWLRVQWKNKVNNAYRFGVFQAGGKRFYDVNLLLKRPREVPSANASARVTQPSDTGGATSAGATSRPRVVCSKCEFSNASSQFSMPAHRLQAPVELRKGDFCVRGKDWKWSMQDGGSLGEVMAHRDPDGWIKVKWRSNGTSNSYRCGGKSGNIDVVYAPQVGDIVCRGPDWKWQVSCETLQLENRVLFILRHS